MESHGPDILCLRSQKNGKPFLQFVGGFVGEFAEGTPWIHLDIAGTSDATASHDLGPKGGTGVMVRTLAAFVEQF